MSTPRVQSLTVLFVSPNGRLPTVATPPDDTSPSLDVVVTETTDQALERVEDGDVHAVVCEHGPPRVDAVEFVAAVRERDDALPVLVYPLDGRLDCTRAVLDAGATDVIETRPESISSPVLVNRIRQFVQSGTGDSTTPSPRTRTNRSQLGSPDSGEFPNTVLAALNQATRELRQVGRKDDVADVVVDVVDAVLGVPGIGVLLFDDGQNHLRPVEMTDTMTEYYGGEAVFGPGKPDSITWRVFVTGETSLLDDVRTSETNVNERTDARSGLFVPLGEQGVLVAATDDVGAFSESSRELLELVGTIAESALDRIENANLLRERDRRLREQDDRLGDYSRILDLIRSVDQVITSETAKGDVETGVLDCLVDDDRFDFAWIGTVDTDDDELIPREWTDDGSQYLDELTFSIGDCTEPACRTARERTVTAAPNVAENLTDGWQRSALSRGFHSVLSVPLMHEDVLYGVLTVYADRPDSFTEPVVSILRQIGETTAYAINGAEWNFSHLSGAVTELELEIESPDDVLNLIAQSVGTAIDCLELTPLSDGSTKLRFSASDVTAESVMATTSGLVAVDSVTHDSSDDDHLFTAVVSGETIGSAITKSGGVSGDITADGSSLVATVNVPETVDVRTFVDRLERRYPAVELRSRRERDRSALTRIGFLDELEAVLTDRQMDVLRTAYDDGFFKSPREATGQDVADELGVSQPTVSHHLREGQAKLLSLLFGDK